MPEDVKISGRARLMRTVTDRRGLEQAQTQRKRFPPPQLRIQRRPPTLFDYRFEDFEIMNYQHHPAIPAPVAV